MDATATKGEVESVNMRNVGGALPAYRNDSFVR